MIRKPILTVILGTALLAGNAVPARGETVDGAEQSNQAKADKARVSIGVSVDYAWWDPLWRRINQTGDMLVYMLLNRAGPYFKFVSPSREYSVDPALLWGARLDADLPGRWGLSAGLIIGRYTDASVMVTSITTNPFSPSEYVKYRVDSLVFDSQVLAHYRFASWFRLSFGPVYQGYTFKERNSSLLSSLSQKEGMHMVGGRAGGAFTIRLVENLCILPEVSFIALYGYATGHPGYSRRSHPIAVGVTALLPVSYYLEKIRTAISVGFRYQFLHYLEAGNSDYLNRQDHRYGVTESITFSF